MKWQNVILSVQHGPSNPPHCCPSHKDACTFMMHVTDDQLKQPITFNSNTIQIATICILNIVIFIVCKSLPLSRHANVTKHKHNH